MDTLGNDSYVEPKDLAGVEPKEWPDILAALRAEIEAGTISVRKVAAEIGISHAGLKRIVNGTISEPHRHTQKRISLWLANRRLLRGMVDAGRGAEAMLGTGEQTSVDEEADLLHLLLGDFELLGTFMTTSTEGLTKEDRRKVALALMSGLKKMAIARGMPIPPRLLELESHFLN